MPKKDPQNGAEGITQGRALACCVPGPPEGYSQEGGREAESASESKVKKLLSWKKENVLARFHWLKEMGRESLILNSVVLEDRTGSRTRENIQVLAEE